MKTKQRLAYSYEANDIRHSILVIEANFGWLVTFIENGVQMRQTTAMGSMMTVMADAMNGMI